jgi:hypothetical protein
MLSLLLSLGLVIVPAQEGYDAALAHLEEGRLDAALAALDGEPAPAVRHEGRARVFFAAGDHLAQVREARLGLEHAPEDLNLLFQGCLGALWLAADGPAEELTGRLTQAVERDPHLTDSDRAAWRAKAEEFRGLSRDLVRQREIREAAASRARLVAGIGLVAAVAALIVLSRGGAAA